MFDIDSSFLRLVFDVNILKQYLTCINFLDRSLDNLLKQLTKNNITRSFHVRNSLPHAFSWICVDAEVSACGAKDELAIQLEEWGGGEEKQDTSSISATEDSLLFERKNMI